MYRYHAQNQNRDYGKFLKCIEIRFIPRSRFADIEYENMQVVLTMNSNYTFKVNLRVWGSNLGGRRDSTSCSLEFTEFF